MSCLGIPPISLVTGDLAMGNLWMSRKLSSLCGRHAIIVSDLHRSRNEVFEGWVICVAWLTFSVIETVFCVFLWREAQQKLEGGVNDWLALPAKYGSAPWYSPMRQRAPVFPLFANKTSNRSRTPREMSNLELLSAGFAAIFGTYVAPKKNGEEISIHDLFKQTYVMRPPSSVRAPGEFDINVITLTGHQITIRVTEELSVDNVKAAIQDQTEIPVEQIRLIFAGKQLVDYQTVKDPMILYILYFAWVVVVPLCLCQTSLIRISITTSLMFKITVRGIWEVDSSISDRTVGNELQSRLLGGTKTTTGSVRMAFEMAGFLSRNEYG